jgi:hypothetical protein
MPREGRDWGTRCDGKGGRAKRGGGGGGVGVGIGEGKWQRRNRSEGGSSVPGPVEGRGRGAVLLVCCSSCRWEVVGPALVTSPDGRTEEVTEKLRRTVPVTAIIAIPEVKDAHTQAHSQHHSTRRPGLEIGAHNTPCHHAFASFRTPSNRIPMPIPNPPSLPFDLLPSRSHARVTTECHCSQVFPLPLTYLYPPCQRSRLSAPH